MYGVNDEKSMVGAKLLCQGFDGIHYESRATGSTNFLIKHGVVSLLGTSTGDKLWNNTYRFANDSGSDGVGVRFTYHILPLLPIVEPPSDYLVLFPNLVHLLIMVILMAKKKPHMAFRQLSEDIDNRPASKFIYFSMLMRKNFKHLNLCNE